MFLFKSVPQGMNTWGTWLEHIGPPERCHLVRAGVVTGPCDGPLVWSAEPYQALVRGSCFQTLLWKTVWFLPRVSQCCCLPSARGHAAFSSAQWPSTDILPSWVGALTSHLDANHLDLFVDIRDLTQSCPHSTTATPWLPGRNL